MFTYFIQGQPLTPVKIGKAINVQKRLRSLQTGSPVELRVLATLVGDRELELHCRFSKYRVFGEWFSWSNELSEFIASECLSTGAAAAVCSMNLYCSDCERAEFNKWHFALYDSADALRDVARACTCQSQADALHASNKILSLLSQIPWIYE